MLHRIQCHLYDLTLPEHQKACFHHTNLQWLPPKVNRIEKGAKYPPELEPELDESNKFKKDAPTLQKQLDLVAHIDSHKFTFKQVVELRRDGELEPALNVTELSRYHSATESRNVWYCECCHDHAKRDKELSLRTEKLWEGIENHKRVRHASGRAQNFF